MARRSLRFWSIQIPGWLLLAYLIYAQAIPAIDYELGVRMGTQESAEIVSEVGTAFWYGFAFGDLAVYIPLLAAGLIGHWRSNRWAPVLMGAGLGITVYWPVVCLAVLVAARDASGWNLAGEAAYWIVLPLIACWGGWSLWYVLKDVDGNRS